MAIALLSWRHASLRQRLLLSLWTGSGLTLLISLFMVDGMVDREILGQFDDSLHNRAVAVAAGIEIPQLSATSSRRGLDHAGGAGEEPGAQVGGQDRDGEIVLREPRQAGAAPQDVRFSLWAADGRLLAGSTPPIDRRLVATAPTTRYFDLSLSGMGLVRAVAIPVQLQRSDSMQAAGALLAVAQSRHEVDELLHRVDAILLVAGIATIVVSSFVVMLSVTRSLRPLGTLTMQLDSISLEAPPQDLKLGDLPAELSPLASRFAALYSRLVSGLDRERRFSRDFAHELRTPLAEIRTVADVALEARAPAAVRAALIETRAAAVEMQQVLDSLLTMARIESGIETLTVEPVELAGMTRRIIAKECARGGADTLGIDDSMPANAWIMTDASLLERILGNLLANAFAHAPPHTRIAVAYRQDEAGGTLEIANTAPDLTADDLEHLAERFWQKSGPVHLQGRHSGLGLSLVDGLCRLLGVSLRFALRDDARLVVSIAGWRSLAESSNNAG